MPDGIEHILEEAPGNPEPPRIDIIAHMRTEERPEGPVRVTTRPYQY
jgi:hypothetical protein